MISVSVIGRDRTLEAQAGLVEPRTITVGRENKRTDFQVRAGVLGVSLQPK